MQGGNSARTSAYFASGLRATPEHPILLERHAGALSAQGQYDEVVHELEHAVTLAPDLAHLQQLLGLAQYNADRTGEAVIAWKRALELSPDQNTAIWLRLRIPLRGVTLMNPELARVLKHEITHSFLSSLTGGRCPTWLNEGMAQVMEPRSSSPFAQPLSALFQQRKNYRSPYWSTCSSAFLTRRRRWHMRSLYPGRRTCVSGTA